MMKFQFVATSWPIDILKTSSFVKITAFTLFSLTLLLFFSRFSPHYSPITFFSPSDAFSASAPSPDQPPPPPPLLPPRPAKVFRLPPLPPVERMGVLDGNGVMTDNFKIGDFYSGLVVDDLWNSSDSREGKEGEGGAGGGVRVKVERYKACDRSMVDYIPCLDNAEAIERLNWSVRGEKYERHCPEEGKGLNCLVPMPKGYRRPIPWPKSRDEVWFSNVPHTRLVEDKGGQNWISRKKDKFVFPGGGTQFIHGADKYLDQISAMVPDIAFGYNTRVALDIGCGVASFGAFLMRRNVTTLSIAPKDVHENQIQFALERGVPALLAVFATHRLLFPSQAFDLIHCSRCRVNWTRDGTHFLSLFKPFIDHLKHLRGNYS